VIKDLGWENFWAKMKTVDSGAIIDVKFGSGGIGDLLILNISGIYVKAPLTEFCDVTHVVMDIRRGNVGVDTKSLGLGKDISSKVREQVSKAFLDLMAGGWLGEGYDFFKDPDPKGTLDKIVATIKGNLAKQPADDRKSEITAEKVKITNVGATITMSQDIVQGAGSGSLQIKAGTDLRLDANPNATAAAPPTAASIKSVRISSDNVIVKKDDAPVARVKALEVSAGVVKITDIELLGEAKALAEKEQGVIAGAAALANVARGLPPGLALAKTILDNPQAVIVPGITRAIIERAFQDALTAFVAKNGSTIGGFDLSAVLGSAPTAPAAQPKPATP
jgi:hypothetical protein